MIKGIYKLKNVQILRMYADKYSKVRSFVENIKDKQFYKHPFHMINRPGESTVGVMFYPDIKTLKNTSLDVNYMAKVYTYLSLPKGQAIFIEAGVIAWIRNSKKMNNSIFKQYIKLPNNVCSMALPAIKCINHIIYDVAGSMQADVFNDVFVPDIMQVFKNNIYQIYRDKKMNKD